MSHLVAMLRSSVIRHNKSLALRAALLAATLMPVQCLFSQGYIFKTYQQSDGLDNLSVQDLTLDKEGFLWIATQNGLYRFLGSTFQRFGPEQGLAGSHNITAVYAAPHGILWVGTQERLYHWVDGQFESSNDRAIPIRDALMIAYEGEGRYQSAIMGVSIDLSTDTMERSTTGKQSPTNQSSPRQMQRINHGSEPSTGSPLRLWRTKELQESRDALEFQTTYDSLTSLLNPGAILAVLDQEIERAQREKTVLTIALADIDHFKQINDLYGHLAGDDVLRVFSRRVSASVRSYNHVGRYGGEEFLIVFGGMDAADVSARLEAFHAEITNLTVTYEE